MCGDVATLGSPRVHGLLSEENSEGARHGVVTNTVAGAILCRECGQPVEFRAAVRCVGCHQNAQLDWEWEFSGV